MAIDNEILRSRLIGYIKKLKGTIISNITIVGYRDSFSGEYIALESSRAKRIFYPNGKIQALNFTYKEYNINPDSFIECKACKAEFSDEINGFVFDEKERPSQVPVKRIITATFETSLTNGLLTQEDIEKITNIYGISSIGDFYLEHEKLLFGPFKYDISKKSVVPCNEKEIGVFEITNAQSRLNFKGNDYYMGDEKSLRLVGAVELQNSNKRKAPRKKAEKEDTIQKEIDELFSKKDEMEETYLEQDDILQKSLSEMERKQDSLKQEVCELEAKRQELQVSVAEAKNEQIPVKTEVKGLKADYSEFFPVKPIEFPAVGDCFTKLEEEDGYSFEYLMKENIGEKALPKVLFDQLADTGNTLASCQACFIPSVSWAYYYAKGIRNAKLYMMHVEHDWLHYKDFLKNGLLDVLESCDENASVNHILVFDSLNLTQPECGLKPLLDVISGYALVIPAFDKLMPRNLKIFATILPFAGENKIGLPLRSDSFSNWGQVAKPEDKFPLPSYFLQNLDSADGFFKGRKDINMSGYSLQNLDSAKGFFDPKDICNKWKSNLKQDNNGYFAD